MEFSRTSTAVFKAIWVKMEFMPMSEMFRRVRAKARNKMTTCFKCRHAFEDGEMMALACFQGKGNKTLCQKCAGELLAAAS